MRRLLVVRRHHSTWPAPGRPEVDDQRQIVASQMLVEAAGPELERMTVEQRFMALRAARTFRDTVGRNPHHGITMPADEMNGSAHGGQHEAAAAAIQERVSPTAVARALTYALPAIWLASQPGFRIEQVWHLSVATMALQTIISVLLLRNQMRTQLGRIGQPQQA
jgi:hypothetical protein